MKSLNIGDFIQCRDKNDMVDTMMELAENGYDTTSLTTLDSIAAVLGLPSNATLNDCVNAVLYG